MWKSTATVSWDCTFSRNGLHTIPRLQFVTKSSPITGQDRSWGFQDFEAPRFQDSRHMKVVRLSALRTDRLYPPGNISGTHFCKRLSQPQGHSAAGRIMSMKNSIDAIGNRTGDLPACSAVPPPTAPPRAPQFVTALHAMYEWPPRSPDLTLINCLFRWMVKDRMFARYSRTVKEVEWHGGFLCWNSWWPGTSRRLISCGRFRAQSCISVTIVNIWDTMLKHIPLIFFSCSCPEGIEGGGAEV